MTQTSSDLQAVVAALRERDRFLVVTHENPDGDALGSLLAMSLGLRQLGKDALMFLSGPAPLPREYAFMQLEGLQDELPADMEERTVVAVAAVFPQVYESVEFAKLKLLARALERARVLEGGRIVVSYLLRTDFSEVGAVEPYSEGIIDYLRAVEGSELAALIREPPRDD